MIKKAASCLFALLLTTFLSTAFSSDLLFRAGFDNGTLTADSARGNADPRNFDTLELGQMAGKGIVGKGALFLDHSKPVIYPASGNINWRQGTISLWISAKNWVPSDKRFQIFFEAWFPNESSRIIIYKFHANSALRFLISANNKEVGYISIPMKDEDWKPGMWHKIDAVWNGEKMQLFLDGQPNRQIQYTKNPVVFKQPLNIKGGDDPNGSIRLGLNPGFSRHNKADIIGYDEVRIYKRMLTEAEIAANYETERSGKPAEIPVQSAAQNDASKDSTTVAGASGDESLNDPSLLFKASFENITVTADKGVGGRKSTNFIPDSLMLRMHQGVAGIGNALTLNNRESVAYPNKGNHDWRKGTISLWVASKNWLPDKKKFQIFFQSKFSHDTRFIIYKFVNPGYLRFVIVVSGKEVGNINVPLKNAEWQPGMWHKIDAVWDDKSMALYLDGNLAKQQPYTKNPFVYRSPLQFPANLHPGHMHLGIDTSFGHDPNDVTAFDELEIYDRILTHAEIRKGYEKFIKPVSDSANPNMVTLPEGKEVTIDGKVDEAEWADAAVIPIANPVKRSYDPATNAKVYLKHRNGNMLVAAEITGGERASITGKDLMDVWRDDAFEIHLINSLKKRYQFIINSLGAFFDATIDRDDGMYEQAKLNSKWQSGAKTAVSRGDGVWFVEMSIPQAAIGVANNEIMGTFCATRYTEKSYHIAWGKNSKNFFDAEAFGRIIFGKAEKPVRFDTYAPYQGHFILNEDASLKLLVSGGRTIDRPAGVRELKLDLASGIYDLTAKGKGYYYTSRFTIDQPLVVSYNCYASRKLLEVKTDLSAAGSAIRNAIKSGSVNGTVQLVDEAGNVCIKQAFTAKDIENIVNLTLPELKQGVYYVEAAVNDGKGAELKARKRFRVPDMTPYKLQVGKDHTVPLPWTPVKQLSAKKYEVWNRTYTFGNGPFPIQITSDGKELLKKGPDFYLDGTPVKWQGFKVTEKHDDYYRFEGTGTAGKLNFRWSSEFWFDGVVKTRIHMNPAGASAEISDLRLKWSVPAEYARAMLEPLYSKYRNKDGEVYRFPYAHGEDFIIWTMGLEKGFLYWPQSNANWNNPAGHRQFSMSRKGDTVDIAADYITKKATLTKEAVYNLAFMATPGRPSPERRRDFNVGQIWDFLKYETLKMQYFGITKEPPPYATEPWTGLKPLDPVKFGQHIKDIEAKGSRYMPYSQPARTCSVEESYDYFFPEWRQKPGWPVGGGISHLTGEFYEPEATCAHTGAGDLFVYRADKLLSDFPALPGLYYDICEGRICWNTLHGCGGVDAFGKEYGDSNLMLHRDYFIRLKRVLTKHGKDKILFLHAHNRFIPFCHGIGDYWYPGEQYADPVTNNLEHFYCENIPLTEWQSAYYTPTHGTGIVFSSIYQITQWRLKLKGNYAVPKYALSVLTPIMLHDLGLTNGYIHHKTVEKWWIIKHDVDLASAKFHGYWFSDAVKSDSDKVYVSWYEWDSPSPYKRLLIVGNMGRTEQPVALRIDGEALGIKGQNVKYYDLWENREITDFSTLKVRGNNFKLIGIK